MRYELLFYSMDMSNINIKEHTCHGYAIVGHENSGEVHFGGRHYVVVCEAEQYRHTKTLGQKYVSETALVSLHICYKICLF